MPETHYPSPDDYSEEEPEMLGDITSTLGPKIRQPAASSDKAATRIPREATSRVAPLPGSALAWSGKTAMIGLITGWQS